LNYGGVCQQISSSIAHIALDTEAKKFYANAMSKKETKAKKRFSDQMEGEQVLYVFRKHPVVMRKGLIVLMIFILIGTIPGLVHPEYSYLFGGVGLGFAIGLIIFFPWWVGWFFSNFIVTNQRFIQITQKGFFHRSVVDIGLKQIQTVNYEIAGFQQTLLGFGTIMMQTYIGDLLIHEVHHPAQIQQRLLGILRDEGIHSTPYPKGKASKEINSNEDDSEDLDDDVEEIELNEA
jgi:uncharacterized membrane protein YdbT with pleckstrin-like domain